MSMIDSGCKVLAVEAEKTIFVQQEDVLDMANRMVLSSVLQTKNL